MDWLECLDAMENLFRFKREQLPDYPDLQLEWGLYHHLRGGVALEGAAGEEEASAARELLAEGHETLARLKRGGAVFDDFHAWDLWAGEHFPANEEAPPGPSAEELRAYLNEGMGPGQEELVAGLLDRVGLLDDLPVALRRAVYCPSFQRLLAAMAEFQARRSRKDAAKRIYALAVLTGRNLARHWLYSAHWEDICGDPEQVDGYLTEGLNHFPDDIDLLRRMAEEKDRQGDVAQAITLLERAVDLKPSWPDLRYDLARLYERSEKPEESLNQFGKALELNPEYEDAALSHAKALLRQGELEAAEEQLVNLPRTEQSSQRIYKMLSQIYAERGDRRRSEHFGVLGAEITSDSGN